VNDMILEIYEKDENNLIACIDAEFVTNPGEFISIFRDEYFNYCVVK